MKLLIASDVHGSEYYLSLLIEAFKREKADKMLLLGDLLYHGPRNDLPKGHNPKKCIEIFNQYKDKIVTVKGNCDCDVDQMVLQFPVLAEYAIIDTPSVTMYATHGHVYNENNPLPMPKNSILLNGHTHVPKCTKHENYVYINPGSISIPKENSEHSYMIFEDGVFVWKNLDGCEYMSYSV